MATAGNWPQRRGFICSTWSGASSRCRVSAPGRLSILIHWSGRCMGIISRQPVSDTPRSRRSRCCARVRRRWQPPPRPRRAGRGRDPAAGRGNGPGKRGASMVAEGDVLRGASARPARFWCVEIPPTEMPVWSRPVCRPGDTFSVVLARNRVVQRAIGSIPEAAWAPVKFPGPVTDPHTGQLISDHPGSRSRACLVPFLRSHK